MRRRECTSVRQASLVWRQPRCHGRPKRVGGVRPEALRPRLSSGYAFAGGLCLAVPQWRYRLLAPEVLAPGCKKVHPIRHQSSLSSKHTAVGIGIECVNTAVGISSTGEMSPFGIAPRARGGLARSNSASTRRWMRIGYPRRHRHRLPGFTCLERSAASMIGSARRRVCKRPGAATVQKTHHKKRRRNATRMSPSTVSANVDGSGTATGASWPRISPDGYRPVCMSM